MERVMMIAGEVSGDLHGSEVIRELKKRNPALDIYGIGGERMKAEGMDVLFHVNSLSVMGFVEVLKHLPLIRKVERTLERCLVERTPRVVVLIDYPGFNLRFARKARRRGLKLLYYIGPQVWAWHKGRLKLMRPLIDKMNVVFPFEVDFYEHEGIPVEFVGHPLVERLRSVCSREEFFRMHGLDRASKLIALLPGSRVQEVRRVLPTMIAAVAKMNGRLPVQAAVGVAPGLRTEILALMPATSKIALVEEGTYGLMEHADAAIVTSGTATLETGWFGTPLIVVYKTSLLTYVIGRLLVRVPHIGLVNIVCGREIVPELIQYEVTVSNLVRELRTMLCDENRARKMRADLAQVRQALGTPGASARVAANIMELAGTA
jgi:lipid-A-disaccharide synthase